jgi:outer membrane protein
MKRLPIVCLLACLLVPLSGHALTLQEGLKIVVESGRDVTIARSQEEAARSTLSLARSPWLPTVDAYARQTWLQYEPQAKTPFGPFPTSQDHFMTYGVKATQILYDFGRTSSTVGAARYGLESREIETTRAANISALNFVISYLDLLEADKLLQVAKEEVQRYEAHKRDAEARLEAGVVTKNEVLQADVKLADSRQRLVTAENVRSLRASKINSLLLRPLNEDVRAEEITESPAAGISLEEAWTTAEAENAELKELNAQIAAKEETVRTVRSEYLPTLYLSGGYEYSENRYLVHEDNWSLIAGINVNLFSGGATNSRVHTAKSEVLSAKLLRDKMLDAVRLEVKGTYLDLLSSKQRIEVTKTAVDQAKENLRLQRLRYQEGVGTATDVLDAVTLMSTAESNSWKAMYDLKRAEASLVYSMGRDIAGMYSK